MGYCCDDRHDRITKMAAVYTADHGNPTGTFYFYLFRVAAAGFWVLCC